MVRPSWDDMWMNIAHVVASRSLCSRAQVGAVIVDERNRPVSTGYNGPPSGYDHKDLECHNWCARGQLHKLDVDVSYNDCPSLHAEMNALIVADRSTFEGGTIYSTSHVCFNCAKAIGNSGLKKVIVQNESIRRDYRNYGNQYEFLTKLGLTIIIRPTKEQIEQGTGDHVWTIE